VRVVTRSPEVRHDHDDLAATRPFDPGRRRFLIAGALCLLAVACGDDEDDPPRDASASDGFPRTLEHGLGDTRIPTKPRRIVATADRDQLDVLLAMGIRPVQYGLSGDYGEEPPPWIDPASVDGIRSARMAGAFDPNLELIAAAHPDLILDAWSEAEMHASLSAIAPTVPIKTSEADSWESAQRLAGEACGEEAAAEAAIAETRSVFAAQAERLRPHARLTVAVASIGGGELLMLPGTVIGGRIVTELGIAVLDTPNGEAATFSLEQIPSLLGDADIILSPDFYGGIADQERNELFRSLPAVEAGRYAVLDPQVATACYQESSLSLRWAASRVADALVAAATGGGRQLG
jgi:iron complex transport system substrate-binding protein